ncbi:hypothetical protein HK101_001684 [Irineochytrium annulatum]|nr:hypothetical protein HK101_001684 [Irineochytrium annulatum]
MKSDDVTARLTDASKYTGSHKERYSNGKGKGIVGRQDLVYVDGSTSSNSRDHLVKETPSKVAPKTVVKAKTDAETFGETARKIVLFQYGDKNHAGEKLVLTKQKFGNWKQMQEQTTKFTPPGKPKMILDRNMNEIKSVDQFQDGGMYLVITSFDKSKCDEAKIPAKFRA